MSGSPDILSLVLPVIRIDSDMELLFLRSSAKRMVTGSISDCDSRKNFALSWSKHQTQGITCMFDLKSRLPHISFPNFMDDNWNILVSKD